LLFSWLIDWLVSCSSSNCGLSFSLECGFTAQVMEHSSLWLFAYFFRLPCLLVG
jgi:hypothetical protein